MTQLQKGKAVGVLHTPTTASKTQRSASVSIAEKIGNLEKKDYAALQTRFAPLDRTLMRSHRAHDGRISYVVTRRGCAYYFTHLHDVQAHLSAIGSRS